MAAKSKAARAYEAKRTTLPNLEESSTEKVTRDKTKAIIAKATQKSHKDVVESLASVKLSLTSALDSISNSLTSELQTLKEVQEAIAAEKMNLELVHGITVEANTLETLMQAHKEQKETFEASMTATRTEWAEEQKLREKMMQQDEADLKAERRREEEQHQYDTKKRHQQEEDQYRATANNQRLEFTNWMTTQKMQLDNREAAVKVAETELANLRAQVAKFEETTKAEVSKATAIATNSLKRDLEHKFEVEKLGLQNTLNLKASEIASLTNRVTELAKTNEVLDSKYKDASSQVQKIAEKAIEGASKVVFTQSSSDSLTNDKRRS